MFELKNVTKTYERRGQTVNALNDTSLTIGDNEFIALVGPSGSGKTTMLSLLGGMMAPTAGEVLFRGESLYDMTLTDRTKLRLKSLGFVFQSFNLVPWLSAIENVQVPLSLAGESASTQETRAAELLDRVGLSDRLHHLPSELSQGQQQRVALARTLANDPHVILADEPTGNLDPDSREQVMNLLSDFHTEGRCIIMVTHDQFAADYAERSLRLIDGNVDNAPLKARAA
ncbi:ABC transporter ATP-binding protein [Fuerstiella marisgermanici]|uniref:Lipoprotein-releasing system ATP-binding protein LolD n=1 Tax=Fuerstiella marisgermanici TaxID=1891926 RepID=A0A1P8WQV0_9PLAN|nr:ABC transporter ATP-binding protein [Fuerstiella marisgermanici]APZ96432.1 Lipoprotein-releasing system ATP-binding protein LolD [Fuerstiella marisgermanici]